MPEQTITRSGAVLPVKVRTARVQHTCSDCGRPIDNPEHPLTLDLRRA